MTEWCAPRPLVAATARYETQFAKDYPAAANRLEPLGERPASTVAGEEVTAVVGRRPRPKVEGRMRPVGVAEVDETCEATAWRVGEAMDGTWIGVKCHWPEVCRQRGQVFLGEFTQVDPGQTTVGVGGDCGYQGVEAGRDAFTQVSSTVVTCYKRRRLHGCLVGFVDASQCVAEVAEEAGPCWTFDLDVVDRNPGDAGHDDVVDVTLVAVSEDPGDCQIGELRETFEDECFLLETCAGPQSVGTLRLDHNVAVADVDACLSPALVDTPSATPEIALSGQDLRRPERA